MKHKFHSIGIKYPAILYFFIMFFISDIYSQNYAYGLRGGMNTMKTYTNSYDKQLFSFGSDYGIFVKRNLYKDFSLNLEINISQKKKAYAEISHSSFIETVDNFMLTFAEILPIDISIKDILETYLGTSSSLINDTVFHFYNDMTHFTYLEIPLMVSYKYKKLRIEAGPHFSFISSAQINSILKQEIPLMDMLPTVLFDTMEYGYLINGTINSLFPAYRDTVYNSMPTTNNYTLFNMGFIAGISYELHPNLFLSMRYSHMFTNMYQIPERNAVHSLVNLSLRYNLRSLFKNSPKL